MKKLTTPFTVCAIALLAAISLFPGCVHLANENELVLLNKKAIEKLARSQIVKRDPYIKIENYKLLSISSVFPSDDVADQEEVILVRFLIEGTQKEEMITEKVFMGYPVGTRIVSWATENVLMDGDGKPLLEEAPIRKYMVPNPIYEEVKDP